MTMIVYSVALDRRKKFICNHKSKMAGTFEIPDRFVFCFDLHPWYLKYPTFELIVDVFMAVTAKQIFIISYIMVENNLNKMYIKANSKCFQMHA